MEEIGKITHFYDKIGVAVILLSADLADLKVGDTIKIKRGNEEIEEEVNSMQINHQDIDSAKAGDEVAVKISGKAKEGDKVYK